jgi:oligopeptide transport system ATP-binding protein
MEKSAYLLDVRGLKKYFPIKTGLFSRGKGFLKAVDNVSFSLQKGETLGLVGESGCGKSTLALALLRLIEPTQGKIQFDGQDILSLTKEKLRFLRKDAQLIFQDPYSSLDPRMNIETIVGEGLKFHSDCGKKERREIVISILREVGLRPEHLNRFPHEFSGGQRQRIGIARALILKPKLVVADEPVSALDVSIQAQVLNLLCGLQDKFAFSYLVISHDLSVVRHMSNRVAVMYLGRIIEMAPADDIYETPLHPYTEALLSVVPIPNPKIRRKKIILKGDVPSPIHPPQGCHFHTRCPRRMSVCNQVDPEVKIAKINHSVRCHLY